MGMISNIDETMLSFKGKSVVFGKKGHKSVVGVDDQTRDHVTIVQTILNNGETFTPLFIFDLKQVPTYFDEETQERSSLCCWAKKGLD